MTILQLIFVSLLGHYKVILSTSFSFYNILFYFTLYVLVAVREELAFREETGILQGITGKGYENIVERNGWIAYLLIMISAMVFFYFYKAKNQRIISIT